MPCRTQNTDIRHSQSNHDSTHAPLVAIGHAAQPDAKLNSTSNARPLREKESDAVIMNAIEVEHSDIGELKLPKYAP